MFKAIRKLLYVLTVFLMVMPIVSCSGGGSDAVGSSGGSDAVGSSGGSGTVGTTDNFILGLTDAPSNNYLNVFVTIVEVQVNQSLDDQVSPWITVSTPNQTFDLLALQNGVIEPLGSTILEAGKYNQMRLILTDVKPASHLYANYVVIEGKEPIELRVLPSELKNGIKIVQGFTIEASGSTELILDFDADKSVVQANGKKGWHLKPTIRVLETVTYSVSGVVVEVVDDTAVPLNGASVSAQIYNDSEGVDLKDKITVVGGTESNSVDVEEDGVIVDGFYKMYLPITQASFNIVATMDDYLPECQVLDSTGIKGYTRNFTLTQVGDIGYFQGSLTGLEESAESADFSIRQEVGSCGMVEVASASIAKTEALPVYPDDYFLPITLPVGTYQVVVSGFGEVTQVWEIQVVAGETTVLDVQFPTPSVYGIVYDGADVPLPGATISAQDAVVEVDETSSDINGSYFMDLPTDRPLNIVATMAGLEPQCEVITQLTSYFIDFTLTAPADGTGTLIGSVTGLVIADSAVFSIRQDNIGDCGMVEVATVSVGNTVALLPLVYFDAITLPDGTYEVVVSAEGDGTQVLSGVVVNGGAETQLDVVFPPVL